MGAIPVNREYVQRREGHILIGDTCVPSCAMYEESKWYMYDRRTAGQVVYMND